MPLPMLRFLSSTHLLGRSKHAQSTEVNGYDYKTGARTVKYNPDFRYAVVGNHRYWLKQRGRMTTATDEEIWNLFEELYAVDFKEEAKALGVDEEEARMLAFMEDLGDKVIDIEESDK